MSSIFNLNSRTSSQGNEQEDEPPKNLAQWVGNELVKELERELASVKLKLEESRNEQQHDEGDAVQLIRKLMDEMTKIGADISTLQDEQERLKKMSSRTAKGELKARLDAAIRENQGLRKRREELNSLLNLLLIEQSESTNDPHKPRDPHKPSAQDLRLQLADLKKQIAEVRLSTFATVGESSRFDNGHPQVQGPNEKPNLKIRLDYEMHEEPLQKRVEDLELEIARLKSELLFIRNSLGRLNSGRTQ